MLSCQQTQNIIDGKKRIILNPNESQKRDFESATFAEGEVYGIDILVSSGEGGKVCFFFFFFFKRIASKCYYFGLTFTCRLVLKNLGQLSSKEIRL
jgi:hypothetical protein